MNYTPRFAQPFTLEQAFLLDVAIIAEEISRLENSLEHLKSTQDALREYISGSSSPDPDVTEAIGENEVVIGSQEERVGMLRLVLRHKGVVRSEHYTEPTPNTDVDGVHL